MSLFFHHQGSGEPLILLHGLFGVSDNLMPISREFSDRFSVYVPDLTNHGRSDHSEEMSYERMAADVALMMDEQGIKQAYFMGHSMGGKVAMTLAKMYPYRVKGLIVADIAPVTYPPYHEKILKGLYSVKMANPSSRREAEAILAEHVEEDFVIRFLLKNLKPDENKQLHWQFNLDCIAQNYHKLTEGIKFEKPYKGPTLFIKGENSDYITREHEDVIRECFPEFQFKMIQNTNHWLHAEKPAAFAKIMDNFLQEQVEKFLSASMF